MQSLLSKFVDIILLSSLPCSLLELLKPAAYDESWMKAQLF
jgi:hypothetical protein